MDMHAFSSIIQLPNVRHEIRNFVKHINKTLCLVVSFKSIFIIFNINLKEKGIERHLNDTILKLYNNTLIFRDSITTHVYVNLIG